MATLLSPDERKALLPPLAETGWAAVPGRDAIRKIWRFADFSQAWGFMSRAALAAEAADHHPEWTNRYNLVDVTLTTHDCGGLSALDLALAARLDRLAGAAAVVADHGAPILTLFEIRTLQR
jgi:4a-hydroxytetrahydrobiopterin dehydratase